MSEHGTERPAADFVGHPAMSNYRISYDGPFTRPGIMGLWYRRFETWYEDGREAGAWMWVRSEAARQ